MIQSILVPGQSAANSTPIVINEGEAAVVSLYTPSGADVAPGPALSLEMLVNGQFMSVSTVGYGTVVLSHGCQQIHIPIVGTFRLVRPDISAWGANVGAEINLYSTTANDVYDFDAMLFSTSYPGLDTLSCGSFTDDFIQRYDAGSF